MVTQPLLSLDDRELLAGCDVDFHRVKGPGGQKRNKTSSAVRLRHHATGLIVTATEERSQHINKARAIHRLREAIALHVRTPIDLKNYAPSEVLRFCISPDGRLRVGRRDERYFPALSELLDVLAECGLRVSDTAKLLGTSTAQLVAFFENDPKLWERVNQMRAEAGKRLLR